MNTVEILGQPVREGIDYKGDGFSCYSSAIGYLMFRLGAPETYWLPSTIDELTGRRPDGLTYDTGSGLLALMDHGAKLTNVHAFNNDRFISEGLTYLEDYYAKTWLGADPANFYQYWQPSRLELQQEFTAKLLARARGFGEQWSEVKENPTVESVTLALDEGDKVLLPTKRVQKNILHYPVLLGHEAKTGDFISFDAGVVPPIQPIDIDYFGRAAFNAEWGMVVVGGQELQ